jgi:DNA-binding LacI/PurR family transcriptional regulator
MPTVHQPVEAMGREMALLLAEMIRGGQPRRLTLDTRLVRRRSG